MDTTSCSAEEAVRALHEADQSIKTAIVMILLGVSRDEAEERLRQENGFVRKCID